MPSPIQSPKACRFYLALIILAVPACTVQQSTLPTITPDSMIAWERPSVDEGIGWKLCVDAHPCVDLGPISARSSHSSGQTYQSRFWSEGVAPHLTPGTHQLAIVVYKVSGGAPESKKSAGLMVQVGSSSKGSSIND
jgi:hypothetical protein